MSTGGRSSLQDGRPWRHRGDMVLRHQRLRRARRVPSIYNIVVLVAVCVWCGFLLVMTLRSSQEKRPLECRWLESPPLVCAHGGASEAAPANTMKAYEQALLLEVDCMEIDASATRDGVLLALHDRDLQRISGVKGHRVSTITYLEFRELERRQNITGDQRSTTLEDALYYVSAAVKQVIIDVKVASPSMAELVAKNVLNVVMKTRCRNCLVWSKEDRVILEYLRQKRFQPALGVLYGLQCGYIVMEDDVTERESGLLRIPEAEVTGVFHPFIDRRLVATAHRAQKKVYAWVVDDEDTMVDKVEVGVDCIVTNRPRTLQQVLRRQANLCRRQTAIPG